MDIRCEFTDMVDVGALVPDPRNANMHDDRQISILAKNIKHQGFRHPIIVSKLNNRICAGHGRLMAAQKLGMTQVPVDYQDFESEADQFRFMIADNKISSLATHDDNLMIEGIRGLDLIDSDFELLGLDDFSLDVLEDQLPELSAMEKGDIEQITFTLHKDQAADVRAAIDRAKDVGPFGPTGNENSNGNAIARISEWFLSENNS